MKSLHDEINVFIKETLLIELIVDANEYIRLLIKIKKHTINFLKNKEESLTEDEINEAIKLKAQVTYINSHREDIELFYKAKLDQKRKIEKLNQP